MDSDESHPMSTYPTLGYRGNPPVHLYLPLHPPSMIILHLEPLQVIQMHMYKE